MSQEKMEHLFFQTKIASGTTQSLDATNSSEKIDLDRLGRDVIGLISIHLDKTDESQNLKSGRTSFNIFRGDFQKNRILTRLAQFAFEGKVAQIAKLTTIRPDLRREVLFTLAGLAAQDEMEPLLRQHPEDLRLFRPLRDISGAQFESISLFQHCLWTKDVRYMANMMLDCLPQNEIGERIRLELVRQYEVHMAHGVVYHLHGIKHEGERHFDLQPLKSELSTFLTHRNSEQSTRDKTLYGNWSYAELKLFWCEHVGKAQETVPAHIRHHYCDPHQALLDNANFTKPKLERSLLTSNARTETTQLWSEGIKGLGSDFAIYSNNEPCMGRQSRIPAVDCANLTALTALDATRTEIDLPALKNRLYTPIQNQKDDLHLQGIDSKP